MTVPSHTRDTVDELLRYVAASVAALAIDATCLLVGARFMHYLWAATLGFLLGAVTIYLLSVRWAFRHRRLAAFPATEFAAFAAIGVVGLGLNNLVIYAAVDRIGTTLLMAKTIAAAVTFIFNFGLRKWGLFRP